MDTPVIDYILDRPTVTNPDGSIPINFPTANIETFGTPLTIQGETYFGSVDLSTTPRGSSVDMTGLTSINKIRFHLRVVFWVPADYVGEQNLVECDRLQFSLSLSGSSSTGVTLEAAVKSRTVGWQASKTGLADLTPSHSTPFVTVEEWHVADLVYDTDTLAHFLDGNPVGIHGFGDQGEIELVDTGSLFIGGSTDSVAFKGQLAAVRLDSGIPLDLEDRLDQKRVTAQWYITTKLESLRPILDLGNLAGPATYDTETNSWLQAYAKGAIMFNSAATSAFAMYGPPLSRYNSMPHPGEDLGYLVSDVVLAEDGSGSKLAFQKGAIYQSADNPEPVAFEVIGNIYVNYEENHAWLTTGYPLQSAQVILEGISQKMQKATWYHKTGASVAHFVTGDILAKYTATGGPDAWGFPVSNEVSIIAKDSETEIGRASEFEMATIFWSPSTGPCEVHGDIRSRYREMGGPGSYLGFPTSDEASILGTGGRFNTFQGGIMCWFGTANSIAIATPFTFFLATVNSVEHEGPFSGQNDLYVNVSLKQGSTYFFNQRDPPSGNFDGGNIVTVNHSYGPVITPSLGAVFDLVVDVWDVDNTSANDHLGTWRMTLDITNAWGFAPNGGILDSGAFDLINNIRASLQPVVDVSKMAEFEKYWGWLLPDGSGGGDFSVDWITRKQFAEAFDGVDSDPEYWDILDGYDTLFYTACIATLARKGTCDGLVLESMYCRCGRSPFSLPLNRFKDWTVGEPTIVPKHTYQLGAQSIWSFLGHVYDGSTHNPVDVFNSTQDGWNKGDIALIRFYQFGNIASPGIGHTVLPVAWNTTANPWTITVLDPNYVGPGLQPRTVYVWPGLAAGTDMWFKYDFSSTVTFSGGRWAGSRMTYAPMSIVGSRPRVPTWDVIPLIVSGVIAIFGDALQTESIVAPDGSDLNATGVAATAALQRGESIEGYFSPVPVCSAGSGVVSSLTPAILISRGNPIPSPSALRNIADISSHRRPAEPLGSDSDPVPSSPFDPLATTDLSANPLPVRPFTHTLTGTSSSNPPKYLLKSGLSTISLSSPDPLSPGETFSVQARNLCTASHTYTVSLSRPRSLLLTLTHLFGLPSTAAASGVPNEATSVTFALTTHSPGRLKVAVRPGLTLVELFPSNTSLIAGAAVTVTVRGLQRREQVFVLDADGGATRGGVRLKINRALVGERLILELLRPGPAGPELVESIEQVALRP